MIYKTISFLTESTEIHLNDNGIFSTEWKDKKYESSIYVNIKRDWKKDVQTYCTNKKKMGDKYIFVNYGFNDSFYIKNYEIAYLYYNEHSKVIEILDELGKPLSLTEDKTGDLFRLINQVMDKGKFTTLNTKYTHFGRQVSLARYTDEKWAFVKKWSQIKLPSFAVIANKYIEELSLLTEGEDNVFFNLLK